MVLRIATLNLEQDHKRWDERRELIAAQLKDVKPDFWALNEIHVPSRAGRLLQQAAQRVIGSQYALVQQSKVGETSRTEAEGLLTRFPVVETGNLDYRSHDCVALVARFDIEGVRLDVYVTHLIAARVEDSARQHQAAELLKWIKSRDDADCSVVCGDFNAAPDQPSIRIMSAAYRCTQTQPTAFTPLKEPGGAPSHPEWERFDRCIDYIWISPSIKVKATGLCFNTPVSDDPHLWPSDHVGVWADLEIG
jgi:endonuclease/exonuclease/phosphatase family metal-dependent hydrolase